MPRIRPILEGLALIAAICGVWMILSAQVNRVPQGPTRSFKLGLSFWPKRDIPDSLIKSGVRVTLENSEVLLAQVPWHPERTPASELTAWVRGLAREHGHGLTIALDWMEANRRVVLGDDWSFTDRKVQRTFTLDVGQVAFHHRPEYLILGVEVDLFAVYSPQEFRSFVALYAEAYSAIKEVSPQTQVGVSFQYESLIAMSLLENNLGDAGPVTAFGSLVDFFAISLYPCLRFSRVDDIPADYLAPLAGLSRPLLISETGWPEGKVDGVQSAFVQWLATQPEISQSNIVIWISSVDSGTYVRPLNGPACPPSVESWRGGLGLWDASVEAKRAAHDWATLLRARRFNRDPRELAKEAPTDPPQPPLY